MAKKDTPRWHSHSVSALVEIGELWRIKEFLQARIRQEVFHPHLYEDYGRVLLLMGDLPEAGKYLFLCGERRLEYEEAIGLFLKRHGKQGWRSLTVAFPRRARNLTLESFPPAVAGEPAKRCYPPERGVFLPPMKKAGWRQGVTAFSFMLGCACFWLLIALSCILGFAQIVQFLFN